MQSTMKNLERSRDEEYRGGEANENLTYVDPVALRRTIEVDKKTKNYHQGARNRAAWKTAPNANL